MSKFNPKHSLEILLAITNEVYPTVIVEEAGSRWSHHLTSKNPLWHNIHAKAFHLREGSDQAHVIAMVEPRLDDMKYVGFFGATSLTIGSEVLRQACAWLDKKNMQPIYGPINGTITSDYRLNVAGDYKIPSEPINPAWYEKSFTDSGFEVFNSYFSARSKNYQTLVRFMTQKKPDREYSHVTVKQFSEEDQLNDLRAYHRLMNLIFPRQSVYCPEISWEERKYNMFNGNNTFDSRYSFFLIDGEKEIGFVVAQEHQRSIVIKTLAIAPEYQKHRLSGLLIRQAQGQASADGIKSAVYSTIREGNAISKMRRRGVTTYRRYKTYVRKPS